MKSKFIINRILPLVCIVFLVSFSTFAQQRKKISLQGLLKDGSGKAVENKNYKATFRLYTTSAGGTAVWSEEQDITTRGGLYSAYIGVKSSLDTSTLNWGANTYFVGVSIEGTELAPRTELTFAPYSLGSPKADLAEKANVATVANTVLCSGAVGDVKYSILNPTQFALQNGNCWVPMDGRSIAGSKLATILGTSTLIDAGGLFIRGQESIGGTSNYDPDRTSASAIATIQNYATQAHSHDLSSGSIGNNGSHSHGVTMSFNSGFAVNNMGGSVTQAANPGSAGSFLSNNNKVKIAAEDNDYFYNIERRLASDTNGSHNHTLSGSTGSNTGNTATETRPSNLNLWTYIRIN